MHISWKGIAITLGVAIAVNAANERGMLSAIGGKKVVKQITPGTTTTQSV